jgi:hypothetical protein
MEFLQKVYGRTLAYVEHSFEVHIAGTDINSSRQTHNVLHDSVYQ